MAKKGKKGYFGLSHLISIILAIIPITNIIFGVVIRITRGKLLGAILNVVGFPIFYILDLITIIIKKDITILA